MSRINQQWFKYMTYLPGGTDSVRAFLLELSRTLDLARTISNLNITPERAREILAGLLPSSVEESADLKSDALKEVSEGKGGGGGKVDASSLYTAYVDGASRGNPGIAGAGVFIIDSDGKPFKRLKKFLGSVTNNVAEYSALIVALESAERFGIKRLSVRADSELVVKQVKGLYRVKSPDLKPLFERVRALLGSFDFFEIAHVRRDLNAEADRLANEAIDTRVPLP